MRRRKSKGPGGEGGKDTREEGEKAEEKEEGAREWDGVGTMSPKRVGTLSPKRVGTMSPHMDGWCGDMWMCLRGNRTGAAGLYLRGCVLRGNWVRPGVGACEAALARE